MARLFGFAPKTVFLTRSIHTIEDENFEIGKSMSDHPYYDEEYWDLVNRLIPVDAGWRDSLITNLLLGKRSKNTGDYPEIVALCKKYQDLKDEEILKAKKKLFERIYAEADILREKGTRS
jgi:hypothetical protein